MVLRPRVLSLYRDKDETKLRHRISLSDLTAVAQQRDPKRRDKHVFGLFSPSRNYHLEASTEQDAHEWVEVIRREAQMDEKEDEMMLASPGGAHTSPYQGFERSIDAHIGASPEERAHPAGYASSSDAEGLSPSYALPKVRTRDSATNYTVARQASYAEYSGADRTSFSDLSDAGGPAARLSALSLAHTDPRPSTSSTQPPPGNSVYGSSIPMRPALGARNPSQLSNLALTTSIPPDPQEEERVVHQSWVYLLKSKSGVRQWKKLWLVIRPKGLTLYKNQEEYAALLVLGIGNIIDAVEVDPISRSKVYCMQIITEERNYRFCAMDEEGRTGCLGAVKAQLSRRRARAKEKEKAREGVGGT
jgi:hypothetical protein